MSLTKQTAAARVAQLPLVRSACASLSVFYGDTKRKNASLKCVCEGLENSVTMLSSAAFHKVSPVITKLQPQVSLANGIACKSLDWLEETFPVLHTPADQLVAGVRSKVQEIQDVVSIAAHGTVDCAQHAVTCVMARVQKPEDQSLVGKAVSVSTKGLASALNVSEALVDRMLPPTEEEKKEEDGLAEGSEVATFERKYSVRLVTLSITLCRRTIRLAAAKIHSSQIMEAFSPSSGQLRILHSSWLALAWSLEQLPLHVQQQIVSAFFYFTQMYNFRVIQQSSSKQDSSVCLSGVASETNPTLHTRISRIFRNQIPTGEQEDPPVS
ncbi:perilipin-2-like isoform X1 [Hippocampus zosterae]|uniref:perilipin-2-like isoform X1 n=1 Tax=Hippocampus zosterae TaxID=109293 RepID=UPI00223D72B2|nr:perilipin-2-like isoform X1 [Hippocampus zosterae]